MSSQDLRSALLLTVDFSKMYYTSKAKGADPRKSWIPEEVGCRLQEGVPPCSSSMAKKVILQKN
jgi:hypothetical protein